MDDKNNPVVGFIGLGTMGSRMAANLQKAGYRLVVNDLASQLAAPLIDGGAVWAATARAVAEKADVIFTSLPEPADVETVALGADGLLAGVRSGAAYFDLSTNAPASVKKIAAAFADKGAHMFDAPVSGGPAGAASGRLAIWVGGDEAVYRQWKPVLDAIGDQARYIGPSGAATFSLGVKAGLDPLALWQAVRQGAGGRRRTFDGLLDQFLPGTYDPPAFALKLAHKDVALANALGRELGVPMRLCNLTYAEMTDAMNRGWAARDSRTVMLLQQERAGVKIAVEPERVEAARAALTNAPNA